MNAPRILPFSADLNGESDLLTDWERTLRPCAPAEARAEGVRFFSVNGVPQCMDGLALAGQLGRRA